MQTPLSPVYRSDLVRALSQAGGKAEDRAFLAQLCGFREEPAQENREPPPPVVELSAPSQPTPTQEATEHTSFAFWRAVAFQADDTPAESRAREEKVEAILNSPPASVEDLDYPDEYGKQGRPLAKWSRLWPFLRKALGGPSRRGSPDIPRAVALLASGKPLHRLPLRPKWKWREKAWILTDRRADLTIFRADYDWLLKRLERARGAMGLRILSVERDPLAPDEFVYFKKELPSGSSKTEVQIRTPLPTPSIETALLALGDLEQYREEADAQKAWLMLGRRLRRRGLTPFALCPCPSHLWSPPMARAWGIAEWDRGTRPTTAAPGRLPGKAPPPPEAAEDLGTLLSAPIRVEPGLLRDLRLHAHRHADVGLEYRFYRESKCAGYRDFSFPAEWSREGRARLPTLPSPLLADLAKLLLHHHAEIPVFLHWEILALHALLPPEKQPLLDPAPLANAEGYRKRLLKALIEQKDAYFSGEEMRRFVGNHAARFAESLIASDPELQVAWWTAHGREGMEIPHFIDPAVIGKLLTPGDCEPTIFFGRGLIAGGRPERGRFPLHRFSTQTRELSVTVNASTRVHTWRGQSVVSAQELTTFAEIRLESGGSTVLLEPITRPAWAKRMWYDPYGLAAEFEVGGVTFVLRWIPPGRILMDPLKYPPDPRWGESLPREQIIERGFWLGETPVTQAQWKVVTGINPSQFKGPDSLPVETVSQEECRAYCEKLNDLLPGIEFRLPSEMEWEYACRAGRNTAPWTQNFTVQFDDNVPELEKIAWFARNSWKEIEVINPEETKSHDWFPAEATHASTHRVKLKAANPWGLYDMLGNVFEWCAAGWTEHGFLGQEDPPNRFFERDRCIIRGGSWFSRAVSRDWTDPNHQGPLVGFRLAAGQETSDGSSDDQPIIHAKERPASEIEKQKLSVNIRASLSAEARFVEKDDANPDP